MWQDILKNQERTFVIESYSTEDEPYKDIETNMMETAKELGLEMDASYEDIEDKLRDWLGEELGDFSGFIWYEITADGEKRDWLNPSSDYDEV
tara:strand:- start:956 stop:1234 length:279 start_codon:yes stop_codon:yes gene_type:complete